MVTNITSLTGNGLKDWLIQRVTAVYFAVFAIFILCYFLAHPHLEYDQWHALCRTAWFQVASGVGLFALILHAWIGIWTVTTDYLSCTLVRLSVQLLTVLLLLSQLLWGLMIVWGQ